MAFTDPYTTVVRLSKGNELGATMNRLRAWLDNQKIQIAAFKTSLDARAYTFQIGFRSIEDAARFRAQFGDSDGTQNELARREHD